jgi:ribosomal protein S28E/S33
MTQKAPRTDPTDDQEAKIKVLILEGRLSDRAIARRAGIKSSTSIRTRRLKYTAVREHRDVREASIAIREAEISAPVREAGVQVLAELEALLPEAKAIFDRLKKRRDLEATAAQLATLDRLIKILEGIARTKTILSNIAGPSATPEQRAAEARAWLQALLARLQPDLRAQVLAAINRPQQGQGGT